MTAAPQHSSLPDSSWRSLYRAGAIAAGLAVVLYVIALALFVGTPAPPEDGGVAMLEHVQGHRTTYLVKQVLWIAPNLLLMIVLLALTVALLSVNRGLALAAGVIAVASWAVSFAWPTTGEGSLAMVVLSDRYAAATTQADRDLFAAGAELLIALNDLPAVILGVLQTFGLLLIALLMLRSALPRGVSWFGFITATTGIVCEALRPILGWAYAVYGLLLFAWLIWMAVVLWRLADRAHSAERSRDVSNQAVFGQ
jgi:hypothetical protein